LASPEDVFDFDGCDVSVDRAALDRIEFDLSATPRVRAWQLPYPLLRRELRWFYTQMRGRVPAVGEAPAREVDAASRICGWLSELKPSHRGAFVLRYDGRRWPARLTRQFGGLTSVVVRFGAMRRLRGRTETLADVEQAAVAELLADIAATGRLPDFTQRGGPMDPAKKLRRLRGAAQNYVLQAECAYFNARGGAPCAVPASREGA
jgi:hypothetical protein